MTLPVLWREELWISTWMMSWSRWAVRWREQEGRAEQVGQGELAEILGDSQNLFGRMELARAVLAEIAEVQPALGFWPQNWRMKVFGLVV